MSREDARIDQPKIGDKDPNDAQRSWQQLMHPCGLNWEGYLSDDSEKSFSEIAEIVRAHIEKTGCKEHEGFHEKLVANVMAEEVGFQSLCFRVVGEGALEGKSFKPIYCMRATRPKYGDVVELSYTDGRSAGFARVARVSELSMTVAVKPLRN